MINLILFIVTTFFDNLGIGLKRDQFHEICETAAIF